MKIKLSKLHVRYPQPGTHRGGRVKAFVVFAGLGSICCAVKAQIVIALPSPALQADTPGQTVSIYVENGGSSVQLLGLDLNLQIADGGPAAGGTQAGPAISSVDLFSPGLLFSVNNNGPSGAGSIVPQVYEIGTLASSGTTLTLPSGLSLLAQVSLDTTGFTDGGLHWDWTLATLNGSTQLIDAHAAPIPITLADGSLTLIPAPEPVDCTTLAVTSMLGFALVQKKLLGIGAVRFGSNCY
jgi:hypothetical protein